MTTVPRKQSSPALAAVSPTSRPSRAASRPPGPAGDYAVIGTTLHHRRRVALRGRRPPRRAKVLDVACGNGAATLAAARRFCTVTGLDYVPALLAQGEERARAERLDVAFVEGDAEALPFIDGQFDAAISTFGVMFTPDHPRAARELARVVRPGGKIGLASWTPDGFIGQLFALVGRTAPPPAGLQPPSLWGTVPHCEELFAGSGRVDAGPAPRVRLPLSVRRSTSSTCSGSSTGRSTSSTRR